MPATVRNERKGERVAAARAVGEGKDAASNRGKDPSANATLVLQRQDSDGTVLRIARVLRKRCPVLGEDPQDPASATYLAASLMAYSADMQPDTASKWASVLREVLSDAGMVLDEDDEEGSIRWVVSQLTNQGVLKVAEAVPHAGDIVLALLEEDEDWHEAIVLEVHEGGSCQVQFLEYGKPQLTLPLNVRTLDTVVDDEDTDEPLEEGVCEICHRQKLRTFHHLIPKDTHPTYLKKRLPPGIHGEPTRGFLNSYGIMICGQCHSYVHRLASNEVLAKQYNTLEKILEHPLVQRWVEWASKQKY